jgi:hypothetical protein
MVNRSMLADVLQVDQPMAGPNDTKGGNFQMVSQFLISHVALTPIPNVADLAVMVNEHRLNLPQLGCRYVCPYRAGI